MLRARAEEQRCEGALAGRGDAVLAAALVALLVAEYAADDAISAAQRVGGIALALLLLPLLARRRRYPLALALVVCGCIAVRFAVPAGGGGVAWGIVAMVAGYTAGAHLAGARAWFGLAATAVTGALVGVYDNDSVDFATVLFYAVWFIAPWLVGRAIRHRRSREHVLAADNVRLERERVEASRRAVADERARIARELHDVVGHAIGVIVLQADGGRRLLRVDPAETERALTTIEQTGRGALDEMRRLVAMLRATDDEHALVPQPGLAGLEDLAAEVRAAGLPVDVVVEGDAAPPAARRRPLGVPDRAGGTHERAQARRPAHARVSCGTARPRSRSRSRTTAAAPQRGAGGGHGLIGMRERAALYGGDVEAGPRPEAGSRSRAGCRYAVRT